MSNQDEALDRALERTVGEIKGNVDALARQVAALLNVWQQQDNLATEGRRVLHHKMERTLEAVSNVQATLQGVVVRMDNVEESTDALKTEVNTLAGLRENLRGGVWVLAILGSVLLGVCGFFARDAWDWAKHQFSSERAAPNLAPVQPRK